MKRLRTYALSAVALGGLFLIGSLMHSRESQAKGAYSTPVTVMNTTSQPAITSGMDDPGRVPYVSQAALGSQSCQLDECVFNFPSVPAGHRLVVQQLSGFIQFGSGTSLAARVATAPLGSTSGEGEFTVNAIPNQGNNLASFNQPYLAYFDGGQTPVVFVISINTLFRGAPFNDSEVVTLKGYLLDCTAAPCSPIAH
jgi:hypothetical protein